MLTAGHRIRDGEFDRPAANIVDTGEMYDCVIVGGGISGLAAALFFQRKSGKNRTCLVLDNHPVFGGEAKRNEFMVDGHRLMAHQGSAVFFVQYPHSFLARFYDSIGLKEPRLQYQKWAGPAKEMALSKTPYDMVGSEPATYGLYFGAKFGQKPGMWLIDPWGKKLEGAPISEAARAELLKWRAGPQQEEKRPQYFGDEISRHLDSITLEEHMMRRFGISRETIRTFLSPVEGGGSGLGPDALSAYADYAADMLHPLQSDDTDQMFPGGNTGIARLMVKTLIPESIAGDGSMEAVCRNNINFAALDQSKSPARIRLNSTAVWVKHDGDPEKSEFVSVVYTRGGKTYRVKARTAVMAGGGWTTRHVVRDLPAGATGRLQSVLSLALHDGQRGAAKLALPLQHGHDRISLVRGRGQLYRGAEDSIDRRGFGHHQPGFTGSAAVEGAVFLSRDCQPPIRVTAAGEKCWQPLSGITKEKSASNLLKCLAASVLMRGAISRESFLTAGGTPTSIRSPAFSSAGTESLRPAKSCELRPSAALHLPILIWLESWTIVARFSRPNAPWDSCSTRS